MVDGVAAFAEDLSRRFAGTSTAVHYVSDVQVFLRWFARPFREVQRTDIDRFIVWQQTLGRARATINRRLVALRMWFGFLADRAHDAGDVGVLNPVHPRRHYRSALRVFRRCIAICTGASLTVTAPLPTPEGHLEGLPAWMHPRLLEYITVQGRGWRLAVAAWDRGPCRAVFDRPSSAPQP